MLKKMKDILLKIREAIEDIIYALLYKKIEILFVIGSVVIGYLAIRQTWF